VYKYRHVASLSYYADELRQLADFEARRCLSSTSSSSLLVRCIQLPVASYQWPSSSRRRSSWLEQSIAACHVRTFTSRLSRSYQDSASRRLILLSCLRYDILFRSHLLHFTAARELPGERNNARNNARCTQAMKATHGLDRQQDVDRNLCGRVNQNDRGQGQMEKVRPWCGQPSDRGRLKNRTVSRGLFFIGDELLNVEFIKVSRFHHRCFAIFLKQSILCLHFGLPAHSCYRAIFSSISSLRRLNLSVIRIYIESTCHLASDVVACRPVRVLIEVYERQPKTAIAASASPVIYGFIGSVLGWWCGVRK